MPPRPLNLARRSFLVGSTEAAGLAVLAAIVGRSTPAAAKAAKGDFMYQDHRHDGKGCGECRFFTPDGPNLDVGRCSIVAGTIRREGWCVAFAPIASTRD